MIKVLVSSVPAEIPAGTRYEPIQDGQLPHGAKISGWFRYSHEGLVLATGEHNHCDDSDFYAIVWDAEAGLPREIEYATTRGWTYANSATVDATDEIRAAYETYRRELARAQSAARDAAEAATPRVGKTVRVIKGRKIPIGTVAEVTWYGAGKVYGYGSRDCPPMRVGILAGGQRVYTDASNVEVIAQATPASAPLLRTELIESGTCPVCGNSADSHEWWDVRAGTAENCSLAS